MMLEVKIPKEITEYKEKIVFGMSARQLACFGLALLVGGGVFCLCVFVLGMTADTATYLVAIAALPFLAAGFIQKNGFTFEKYIGLMVRHNLGKKEREYEPEHNLSVKEGLKIAEFSKKIAKKEKRKNRKRKEYTSAYRKEKSRKAKIKGAKSKIKGVRSECRKEGKRIQTKI